MINLAERDFDELDDSNSIQNYYTDGSDDIDDFLKSLMRLEFRNLFN